MDQNQVQQATSTVLPNHPTHITQEMTDFYDKRTNEHITRVINNMILMEGYQGLNLQTLTERGAIHDKSKFSDPEKEGYVWLSWWHYCRRNGKGFDYPTGVDLLVKQAIDHHLKCNLHHHEAHKNSNDMTWLDIVEMVCDWTAMSQEYNEKSCLNYVNQNIDKIGFSEAKKQDVYNTIAEIDKRLESKK